VISSLPAQRDITDEQAHYYDSLAAAYYRSGNMPRALETYREIVSLTTGRLQWGGIYAWSYYWLGKIHQELGNRVEAASNYEKFLQLWKNDESGLPEAADAQIQLKALRKGA
jgi:tetratricopeptide (TPR) repeat protein